MADVDDHALAINVGRSKRARFVDPQAGGVRDDDDDAVLERLDALQQRVDLGTAQYLRKGLGDFWQRDARSHIGQVQRVVVEELDGGSMHLVLVRSPLPIAHEIQQEPLHALVAELIGVVLYVAQVVANAAHVSKHCLRSVAPKLHVGLE